MPQNLGCVVISNVNSKCVRSKFGSILREINYGAIMSLFLSLKCLGTSDENVL